MSQRCTRWAPTWLYMTLAWGERDVVSTPPTISIAVSLKARCTSVGPISPCRICGPVLPISLRQCSPRGSPPSRASAISNVATRTWRIRCAVSVYRSAKCQGNQIRAAARRVLHHDGSDGALESSGPSLGTLLVLLSGSTACPDGSSEFPRLVDRHRAPGGEHPATHGGDDGLDNRRIGLQSAAGSSKTR